jgi:hypothetical protein
MKPTGGTILERAVSSWEASPFAYLQPVLAEPQPEQYKLARRIAEEYPGRFDEELAALLSSNNPVVVAQALTILKWTRSPVLAELPDAGVGAGPGSSAACCGAAGTYALLRPDDSARVLAPKLDQIEAAGVDYVAVVNPGCLRQLRQGLRRRRSRVRAVHLAELLTWAGESGFQHERRSS